MKFIESKKKALEIARAASGKKALDVVLVDMRKVSSVCDYFVIASGTSSTQVRAISESIIKTLKSKGVRLWHIEGQRDALWVLLDYGDVVAHIFYDETRHFYDLERLWGDAPKKRFKEVRIKKRISPYAKKRRKRTSKTSSR